MGAQALAEGRVHSLKSIRADIHSSHFSSDEVIYSKLVSIS